MSDSRDRLALAGVVAAVTVAYANAGLASFQFDDFLVIVDNPAVHSGSAWWAEQPSMRALLKLSYLANWALSPSPAGFHYTNVAIHLVNVFLVYLLVRQLGPMTPGDGARWPALLVAAMFGVHPIQTEAVTYVSGRSMSLMTTGYLAALWCLCTSGKARWRWLALAGGTLAFMAAMMVKETAITFVLGAWLWLWMRDRAVADGRRAMAPLVGLTLISLLGLVALWQVPGYRRLFGPALDAQRIVESLWLQGQVVPLLIGRLAAPWSLSIDPDWTALVQHRLAGASVVALFVTALLIGWRWRTRSRWILGGMGWALIQLAPGNSVLARWDIANERHLYLANIGLFVALAAILRLMMPARSAAGGSSPSVVYRASVLTVLFLLMAMTWARNQDYRTEVSLWQATVRASPGKARVHNNLGFAYAKSGRFEEAAAAYRESIRLDPANDRARCNLAELVSAGLAQARQWDASAARTTDCARRIRNPL